MGAVFFGLSSVAYGGGNIPFSFVPRLPAKYSISALAFASSQGSSTLKVPATSAAGDLVLFCARWYQATMDVPSGFTQLFDVEEVGFTDDRMACSYRIDDGTLANMTMPGIATSTYNNQWVIVLRSSGGSFAGATAYGVQLYVGSATDPPPLTIQSSTGRGPMLVVGYERHNNTGGTFSTESPAFTSKYSLGASSGGQVGYSLYNSGDSLVNHTIDIGNVSSLNRLGGFFILFD